MPILINHPAHIHGLWAITPDRSRLSSSGQPIGYEDEATRWNNFMFQTCVSLSWAKLLLQRSRTSFKKERFALWPQVTSSPVDLWGRLDDWVIDTIISKGLPVWNANGKCVDIVSAYLFPDNSSNQTYASAIASVMPAAVFLKDSLLEKVIGRSAIWKAPKQITTPSIMKQYLRDNVPVIQGYAAPLLLEYCLLDALASERQGSSRAALYEDLQGIPFWPNIAGGLSSAGHLLLPRDAQEMELFKEARKTETLDIKRIAHPLLNLLWRDVGYMSAIIRFRAVSDLLMDWPLMYPVSKENSNLPSLLARSPTLETTLRNIWIWISERYNKDNVVLPSTCYELWLLPVNNFRIRKFVPSTGSRPMLIASEPDALYHMMVEIASGAHVEAPPILDIEVLSADALKLLRELAEPSFHGASSNDFRSFVSWLAASKDMIATATEQQKVSVLQRLEVLAKTSMVSIHSDISVRENLKQLPLFKKVECLPPFE